MNNMPESLLLPCRTAITEAFLPCLQQQAGKRISCRLILLRKDRDMFLRQPHRKAYSTTTAPGEAHGKHVPGLKALPVPELIFRQLLEPFHIKYFQSVEGKFPDYALRPQPAKGPVQCSAMYTECCGKRRL